MKKKTVFVTVPVTRLILIAGASPGIVICQNLSNIAIVNVLLQNIIALPVASG